MSIAHKTNVNIFTMLMYDSYLLMEEFDHGVMENRIIHKSRSTKLKLNSLDSSASSSSNSNSNQRQLEDAENLSRNSTNTICSASSTMIATTTATTNSLILSEQTRNLCASSAPFIFDNQRRRPIIDDPYKLLPNLETLNEWMITTTGKSRRELSEVHGFSEEQIAVFEESFSLLDKDGDGNISQNEIRSLMISLGYSPSEEDISTVISKVDTDGNGGVDFDEFLTMMKRRRSIGENDTELHQVFKVFDKNKDGYIDKDELYDMLVRLGERITQEDIQEMIEEADCLDHDGKVSYEEFKAILHSK